MATTPVPNGEWGGTISWTPLRGGPHYCHIMPRVAGGVNPKLAERERGVRVLDFRLRERDIAAVSAESLGASETLAESLSLLGPPHRAAGVLKSNVANRGFAEHAHRLRHA